MKRSLRAILPKAVGLYMAKVVNVDAERHTVDVEPETELGQTWTKVPYQPLVERFEGEWHDPVVGAAVVVVQDALGRRRVLGPPEAFSEWHLVSQAAKVRLDLTKTRLEVTIDGGVRVDINGTEVKVDGASLVQVNGGTHSALRGDVVKAWADAHVHAGPSGPPVVPLPDEALNQTVKLD